MKTIRKYIRDYRTTCACAFVGAALYVLSLVFDIDIFEALLKLLRNHEHAEADEIVIAAVLTTAGLIADLVRMRLRRDHELEVQRQRLRVLKATMRTVQDIVNNALNGLVLMRLEGESGKPLDRESLRLMDSIIYETSQKLKELGDLDDTPGREIDSGITKIDVGRGSNKKGRLAAHPIREKKRESVPYDEENSFTRWGCSRCS
jgi:hypothetical protein